MAYRKLAVICDWCNLVILNYEGVACVRCYEQLESELVATKAEIERLRKTIAQLEHPSI